MTTHFDKEFKCDCCGETFTDRVIGSTSEFGYCDLDTRPAPPKRFALPLWIHKCPNCGYVIENGEVDDDLIEYIKSDKYQTSENRNFTDENVDKYYKNGLLLIKNGKLLDAAFSFLNAAWVCDDCNLVDDAIECRKQFLKHVDNISNKNINKTVDLIRFDVLRRIGEFDILLDECDPNYFDEEIMVKIAEFERLKAKERDTGCYTVESVIS